MIINKNSIVISEVKLKYFFLLTLVHFFLIIIFREKHPLPISSMIIVLSTYYLKCHKEIISNLHHYHFIHMLIFHLNLMNFYHFSHAS